MLWALYFGFPMVCLLVYLVSQVYLVTTTLDTLFHLGRVGKKYSGGLPKECFLRDRGAVVIRRITAARTEPRAQRDLCEDRRMSSPKTNPVGTIPNQKPQPLFNTSTKLTSSRYRSRNNILYTRNPLSNRLFKSTLYTRKTLPRRSLPLFNIQFIICNDGFQILGWDYKRGFRVCSWD